MIPIYSQLHRPPLQKTPLQKTRIPDGPFATKLVTFFRRYGRLWTAGGNSMVDMTEFRDHAKNRSARKSENGEFFLERAAKSFQENVARAGPMALASYTLIGAILVLGGIGYAMDRWAGTSPWFLLGGLLLGLIVGFYELARVVWRR